MKDLQWLLFSFLEAAQCFLQNDLTVRETLEKMKNSPNLSKSCVQLCIILLHLLIAL